MRKGEGQKLLLPTLPGTFCIRLRGEKASQRPFPWYESGVDQLVSLIALEDALDESPTY